MKKLLLIIIVLAIILIIPVSCFAMTPNEFLNTYDYEYQYMIKFNSGATNYISSDKPVTFDMSIYNNKGEKLVSGNSLVLNNKGILYKLNNSGDVTSYTHPKIYIMRDQANKIGFEYADIYQSNGSSFFLPITLKQSPYQRILTGLIPLIGLVISVICFRKGWAFLRNQLQH